MTAPPAAPQQERSRATQQRLLEADRRLPGPAPAGRARRPRVIAERAGVSRGAQLHHYPTRAARVLAAAATHLAERRAEEIRVEAAALPTGNRDERLDKVMDMLAARRSPARCSSPRWRYGSPPAPTPSCATALVPLEARVGREMHRLTVEVLAADERRPGVREAVQATLDLLRGLGVANLLTDDSARRTRLLADWTTHLASPPTSGPCGGRSGSATPPASTATGVARSGRCSRAGRSTSSPATTSPS